jgi:hypothetical protein
MEPDYPGNDPRKFKISWTFGPIQFGGEPIPNQPFPPVSDEEFDAVMRKLEELSAGFETEMQLEAMDLLEADVQASDCAEAKQMLAAIFKPGA